MSDTSYDIGGRPPTPELGALVQTGWAARNPTEAAHNGQHGQGMGLKAFIVEDSAVIRDNLVAALEEMVPLKVVGTAEDEAGALQWLANPQHACDIAIVDIFLRRGTGLNVLRALQRNGHSSERVVLTNYATDEIRRHALALGATRVFDKSGEIDALVEHCMALAETHDGSSLGTPEAPEP
jgi:DNA-binding NarL/FixJ family response regulator